MPWYKAGTVSVVQNSNTVTGTNTSFIANSRVGDGFLGPDGRWYEITNIASDTALAISPNYLGATNSAGTYALVPINGYPKALADAFNGLNNQFGTTLAALGTTGNYDILPVTKGGTGATDAPGARLELGLATQTVDAVPVARGGTGGNSQATARTGLGLGSVAVESTVPLNKGGTGRSDGRAVFSEVGVQLPAALYGTQGMYAGWNGDISGAGNFVCNRGSGLGGFSWRSVNGGNTESGPLMTYSYGGVLNLPVMPTVGGSPIVARGSNASGAFIRYANGDQICHKRVGTTALNTQVGSMFASAAAGAGAFPAEFSSMPTIVPSACVSGYVGDTTAMNYTEPTQVNWGNWRAYCPYISGSGVFINLIAVGRWYE